MTLKAIIFDMDDTLIDWEPVQIDWLAFEHAQLRDVFTYINETVGQILPGYDDFVQAHHARVMANWAHADRTLEAPGLGSILMETLGQFGVPTEQLEVETCLRAYNWASLPGAAPFPEVPEMVRHLREQGLRLGIITNAFHPMWMRDRELQGYGLSPDLFDYRISSADAGYMKPHPASFEKVMNALEISADEGVFIGDSLKADIAGAQGVGMKAVWRTRENQPSTALPNDEIVPDASITSLQDLLPILDDWYPGWNK